MRKDKLQGFPYKTDWSYLTNICSGYVKAVIAIFGAVSVCFVGNMFWLAIIVLWMR